MNRIVRLTLALGIVGLVTLMLALAAGARLPALAAGATIKVPDDYLTIQAAIDAATDGDTILVAEGVYGENLSITEGITLSGGWNISFTARFPGASIIDAQGLGRAVSITCAASDTVVTIDGFTVQSGNATGLSGPVTVLREKDLFQGVMTPPSPPAPDARTSAERAADLRARLADLAARGLYPGGEAAYQATLARLDRLVAQAEQALARSRSTETADASLQPGDCGGGVYSWNASLRLLNCTIKGNIASMTGNGYGGGVFAGQAPPGGVRIAGNIMHDNIASASNVPLSQGVGGGLYVRQVPGAVIVDNVLRENVASSIGVAGVGVGGGLAVESSISPVVHGNRIARNTAGAGWETLAGLGGGAYMRYVSGAIVTDNVFQENLGVLYGGGGSGGLILIASQGVLVSDNTATGNWGCALQPEMTDVSGGAFSLHNVAAATVTGNAVWGNVACLSGPHVGNSYGGGIDGQLFFNSSITSNTITGNVACQAGVGWGGGVSFWAAEDSVVADNTLADNIGTLSGGGGGGGVFLRNTDRCLVYHNRFQGNQGAGEGEGSGGGLRVEGQGPYSFDTTVDANLFLDNQACVYPIGASFGGACVVGTDGFTFTNNVVAGNTADQGGGLALEYAPRGVVVNNTLASNSDTGVLVDQYSHTPITFTNNIVVSHTVGITVAEGATATVRYTLWHGNGTDIDGAGAISHTHAVVGAPAFVDPAAHDYHLTPTSAARDAGDPAGVPPAPPVDRDGVPRPQGLGVDIGAYEWFVGHQIYLPLAMRDWQAYVGWAVGDSADGYGTILHTTDSGNTWVRQGGPGQIPDLDLHAVSAVDEANAWVVGQDVILRTRDGGQTWEQQALPAGVPTNTGLFGVKAIDGNTAWAVGSYDTFLQTTDGQTWSVMPRGADLHLSSPVQYSDVDAADATHVWAVGGFDPGAGPGPRGEVVIAFYDGAQWRRQGTGVIPSGNGAALIGVSALDQYTVWAVGGPGLPLVKTTDGGASWQQGQPPIPGLYDTNRVVAVTASVGWATGDNGNVQRTDDGGQSWVSQRPLGVGAYLYTVTAVDTQMAWAVGPKDIGMDAGWLLRTFDGQHWEARLAPVEVSLSGVSFVGARR